MAISGSVPSLTAVAGAHGYFTVDLQPGNYAFIAEVPRPRELGLVLPFTVEAAN
ncbi:MAG: hypothetical protein IIC12_02035 [Proteobacteria bacterium]|nr:hypothetical protein [Pseudomonadota bacterium]